MARIRIEGLREVRAALRRLPPQAREELRAGSYRLADTLVQRIKATAAGRGRQAAKAARSVRVVKSEFPIIQAGGPSKAGVLVNGTEFGATRHFGWFNRARYYDSPERQFPPHLGQHSYWFFVTVDRNRHAIEAEADMIGDNTVRRWSA